jgi:GT2 family glycosyltransferase
MLYSRSPLSIVIPTWNALRFLPATIAALQAQLQPDDEIILVDNGSRDHAAAWAARYAPDIRVVQLPVNRGFAGGTNAGICAARHSHLLLCNDDAMVEPGAVDALWNALQHTPNSSSIGGVAGVMTFSRAPSLVASAGILVRRDGIAIDRGIGEQVDTLPPAPIEVFGISGGFALLRRSFLDDVGLFEERFFCYLEDADFAWRGQLRGWKTMLAPAARARHVYSASGGSFKQRLLARNRLRVIIRCMPTPLLSTCAAAIVKYDLLAIGYGLLRHQQAVVRGRLDALEELPALLAQRRRIQASRTVAVGALTPWLEPAPTLFHSLRLQKTLAHILGDTYR